MIRLKDILLEGMTPDVADTIFAKFGIEKASSLDKGKLKDYYIALVKKHHPDAGGSDEDMRYINAAYDVLKDAEPPDTSEPADLWAGRTVPKDPKTKHMYTTKFTVQFRSVLSGKLLYQGKLDQIDFTAILNKLKQARVYTEVEGNNVYVDVKGFSSILPDLTHFFRE